MNRSLAVGSAVATLCIAGVGVAVAAPKLAAGPPHQFTITFPTASGLVSGSDVLEAGAKVGVISTIEPIANDQARVTVAVEDSHWPLHQGLQAAIRPKSLLGEKYVDLHDGPAKNAVYDVGKDLKAPADSTPVELDQFINSLDGDTRSALKVLLNDLGAGLGGRGVDLNKAIQTGRDDLAHLAVTGQTLNNRDPDLDRILVGLDGVLSKITQDDQLTQMSQLIDHGKATLDAIEAEQAAFSRSFVDANTALAELNTSFDTVVASLRHTLDVAPGLLNTVHEESDLLTLFGAGMTQGDTLSTLMHAIASGPQTTGGAVETVPQPDGSTKTLPIFRVCLMNQTGSPTGGSCTGNYMNSHKGNGTPPQYPNSNTAYSGGASDIAGLAAWMGA